MALSYQTFHNHCFAVPKLCFVCWLLCLLCRNRIHIGGPDSMVCFEENTIQHKHMFLNYWHLFCQSWPNTYLFHHLVILLRIHYQYSHFFLPMLVNDNFIAWQHPHLYMEITGATWSHSSVIIVGKSLSSESWVISLVLFTPVFPCTFRVHVLHILALLIKFDEAEGWISCFFWNSFLYSMWAH